MKKVLMLVVLIATLSFANAQTQTFNPYEFYQTHRSVELMSRYPIGKIFTQEIRQAEYNQPHSVPLIKDYPDVSYDASYETVSFVQSFEEKFQKGIIKGFDITTGLSIIKSYMEGTITKGAPLRKENNFFVIDISGKLCVAVVFWSILYNEWHMVVIDEHDKKFLKFISSENKISNF